MLSGGWQFRTCAVTIKSRDTKACWAFQWPSCKRSKGLAAAVLSQRFCLGALCALHGRAFQSTTAAIARACADARTMTFRTCWRGYPASWPTE
eukprot:s2733_g2.t1